MNNHPTGSGALDRDEGHVADLCHRSRSGMAASTESSSCANRMDRSRERKKSHEALNYTFGAGVDHKPLEIHRGAYPLVFSLDLA